MDRIRIFIDSILLPVLVGALVGIVTSSSMDYSTLTKPPLAPQSIVFPIVWTILYILMGVSYGILSYKNKANEEINRIYYLQLIVNALWPLFFFTLKSRLFAFIWIILLAILVVIMIIRFYNKNKTAGLLQIPYLLWVVFASYLNLSIYLLNR